MKFRKRPVVVVIEAEQWFPGGQVPGVVEMYNPDIDQCKGFPPHPFVRTLEGKTFVSPGDWIITSVDGERDACEPDIFRLTYELVEGEC